MRPSDPKKHSSRVLIQGMMAGFSLARVFTGPIRAHYERVYKHVRRWARVVFLFDAALIILVCMLGILILSLVFRPVGAPDIDVRFEMPTIASADPTPVILRLRSLSDTSYAFVRMRWRVPPGVQILEASVPFDGRDLVSSGGLSANSERTIYAVVRAFHPEGSSLPFSFFIEASDRTWGRRTYGADAIRTVEGSAVITDIPPEVDFSCASDDSAVLPLRIRNTSARAIPSMELRPVETSDSVVERVALGDLLPHETRYVFVPIIPASDGVARLHWEVFAASRSLQSGSRFIQTIPWDHGTIESPPVAYPNEPVAVRVRNIVASSSLIAVLPSSDDPFIMPIPADASSLELPAWDASSTRSRWMTAIASPEGDQACFGPASFGMSRSGIPFSQSIRYTSESGDQIGAGPLPFIPNEETRLWVLWNIGPVDANLSSIHVSARLPDGVEATRNIMAPDGGTWKTTGRVIEWNLPNVNADVSSALFGFEIAVRPSSEESSSTLSLIGEASVRGTDALTETILRSTAPALDSDAVDR